MDFGSGSSSEFVWLFSGKGIRNGLKDLKVVKVVFKWGKAYVLDSK